MKILKPVFLPVVVFLTSLAVSFPCIAQSDSPKKKSGRRKSAQITKTSPEKAVDQDDDFGVDSMPSKDLRLQKPYHLGLNYTPISDFFLKYGFNFSYNYRDQVEFFFNFLTGGENLTVPTSPLVRIDELKVSGMQSVGGGRFFFGNSFAVTAGLGLRQAEAKMGFSLPSNGSFLSTHVETSNIIFFSSIGNHWNFANGLTLGCDWLSVSMPLTKSHKHSTSQSGISTIEQQEIDRLMDDLGKRISEITHLTFANIYLGFRF